MYELRNDLPAPERPRPNLRPRYPFNRMEIGQNFAVPAEAERLALSAVRRHRGRHPDFHYAVGRDGEGVLRIWRVVAPPAGREDPA